MVDLQRWIFPNMNILHVKWIKLIHILCVRGDFWQFLPFKLVFPTGGPSSSCEMIILHNNSHGGIIRVCMRIFTTALRNKIIRQILNKNTSPYFHSVSLVIWPFTLMKRTHFSELSISRFSIYIRKGFSDCCCARWSSHSWSLGVVPYNVLKFSTVALVT